MFQFPNVNGCCENWFAVGAVALCRRFVALKDQRPDGTFQVPSLYYTCYNDIKDLGGF